MPSTPADACPTTLATLQQALRTLGSGAAQVRVLFVTVDPQRDTQAVLKRYVGYFGPQFVGLSGDDSQLNALTHRYRVAYHRGKSDSQGYYSVDHSSAVFVFDRMGQARLLADTPRELQSSARIWGGCFHPADRFAALAFHEAR